VLGVFGFFLFKLYLIMEDKIKMLSSTSGAAKKRKQKKN
jgi:hypothetical protein